MDRVLEDLILSLRRSGVRVSPSESMDAARAVELVGYGDREALKGALSAALAKSRPEREIFDGCFERFFTLEPPVLSRISSEDARGSDGPDEESSLAGMLLSGDGAGVALAIQMAADAVDVSSLRFFTQRGQVIQRILRQMGFPELSGDIERMGRGQSMGGSGSALERARDEIFEAVRGYVERQFALFAPRAAEPFGEEYYLNSRLSGIDERDYERLQRIVRRMVKRLNALYARRRSLARMGVLDFKKTFRASMANQGVLADVRWKKRRPDRPDIVAICDISRSVRHLTRFFLLFLYSLNEIVARIRTYLFCSDLVEATRVFESYPLEEAVNRIETGNGLQVTMGLTDYGRALSDFKQNHFNRLSRKTTVFIIGDARNNYDDPKAEILGLIRQRCRRVIWLNPESPLQWRTGDSVMRSFLPHCDVARECNTLNHLGAVAALLSRTG